MGVDVLALVIRPQLTAANGERLLRCRIDGEEQGNQEEEMPVIH